SVYALLLAFFVLMTLIAGSQDMRIGLLIGLAGIGLNFLFIMIEVFLLMFGEKRTELGRLEAGKWQAFKKHMKDYEKTKKYPLDSIVIWEKYLVYGMLFGISAKALAEFPVKFDPAQ